MGVEATMDKAQTDLLDRLQQINSLKSENASYKHQIEIFKSSGGSFADIGQLTNVKTLKALQLDDSGLSSDPKLMQFQKSNVSQADGPIFYQQSDSNVFHGIYGGLSPTNIGGNSSVFEKKLKYEQSTHEQEMEELTAKLEQMKREKSKDQEIQNLNGEIQKLTEQNLQKQGG